MFGKEVLLVGSLVAAVTTGLYVVFGSSKKRNSKRKDTCLGLENLGNTCFLNAILQSWASCRCILQWLENFSKSRSSSTDNQDYFAGSVLKTLKVLNNEDEEIDEDLDYYSPADIINALRIRRWVISPTEQDAHELFHVLTQTLDEETTKYPGVVSLFDVGTLQNKMNRYQPEGQAVTKSKGLLPLLPHNQLDHPFRGLLASHLQCRCCGYKYPVRYDLFDSLSLSLPGNIWGQLSLKRLLELYIRPEVVADVDCPGCTKLQQNELNEEDHKKVVKSSFMKKLAIGKLPECLCIHIQRTQWLSNGSPLKRYDHVHFPEILHMDDFVYSKCSQNELEMRRGLFGGNRLPFFSQGSPGMNVSNSAPVNLLRALNYDSKTSANGLYFKPPPSPPVPNTMSDMDHNTPHPSTDNTDINHNQPVMQELSKRDHTYRLASVVEHLGDVYSGHFVAYRRNVPGGNQDRWMYTSDTTVRRASVETVFNSQAYMLFYQRI